MRFYFHFVDFTLFLTPSLNDLTCCEDSHYYI